MDQTLSDFPCRRRAGHGLDATGKFCRHCMLAWPYATNPPVPKTNVGMRKRKRLMKRDGPFCWWCGVPLLLDNSTVDHVMPISKGGVNRIWNTVLCCRYCNNEKGDKHPLVWIASIFTNPRIGFLHDQTHAPRRFAWEHAPLGEGRQDGEAREGGPDLPAR